MATGTEAKIAAALFDRLLTLTTSPVTSIAWPNVDFNGSPPYLEVSHLPNRSEGPLLDTTKDLRGFLQVTVVYAVGVGIIDPMEIASQVIAHFPVTLRTGSSPLVTFPQPAFSGPPFQDGNEIRVPVSIPYLASI